MKPVYKCDYCSHMGTEEDVKEHEIKRAENYDRRSCYTCKHKRTVPCKSENAMKTEWEYKCELKKEIPKGKIFEFCDLYERKEKQNFENIFSDMLFGRW